MKTEFEELKTYEDLSLVREIADTVWPVTFAGILSPEQIRYMMNMMYSPEVMNRELDRGYHFEVIRINGEAAGYISYSPCEGEPGTAKLHKVYLMHQYHGLGIGQQMLEHAQKQCRKLGFSSVLLTVNKQNSKAIKAYQRNGFATVDAVKTDIGGGFFMDDFIMRKSLL